MISKHQSAAASGHQAMRPLDPNELEALKLFASGRTADEIAIALDVSKSMAQHYLRVAARKLGARNRVHAVAIAVRLGLIEVPGGGR
jgi:LuxR family transcriptional regulator